MNIKKLQAHVYRVPIDKPLKAPFGEMRDRPAVLVRAEADDGTVGWGETWCNFPTVGAEHRARLINETLAPIVCGAAFKDPRSMFERLTTAMHVLAIQAGEPGPLAQAIAGVDIALWDVAARQANLPLSAHLSRTFGDASPSGAVSMACYASGLGPEVPADQAAAAQLAGHRAFKLKVGFGDEIDLGNLAAMRAVVGTDAMIAIDANQRWTVDQAAAKAASLAAYKLYWLEEPLPADRPPTEWRRLAGLCAIPLAGGENLRDTGLTDALGDNYFQFVQPDIAKWGGFSAGYPLAKAIQAAGKTFCPHYLGGGIGLVASAHLLAAAGGDGLLEVDYNPNPLRHLLADPLPTVTDGQFHLDDKPGLGVNPKSEELAIYQTL